MLYHSFSSLVFLSNAEAAEIRKALSMKRTWEQAEISPSQSAITAHQESLVMSVLAVMKEAYKPMPKELWGLSRSTDWLAPRGFVIDDKEALCRYYLRMGRKQRYPIVSLKTAKQFNEPICISPGVFRVTFGSRFEYEVEVVPDGVTELRFEDEEDGEGFNHPLVLPEGLKTLQMGFCFNHPITLPHSLLEARFGIDYDQPLSLPPKLQTLHFHWDGDFNYPLVLPEALRELALSARFNHPISLPSKLQKLILSSDFNQPLALPDGLKSLSIEGRVMTDPLSLPDSVEELILFSDCPIVRMSSGLKLLEVGLNFTHPVALPDGLEDLRWRSQKAVKLPKGLKKVYFEYGLKPVLPQGLEKLIYGGSYYVQLDLPEGCERLDDHYIDPLVRWF